MNNGFIVIQRKILDWEWYDDPNTFRLFLHFILTANHAPKKWRGQTIERGQLITGRKALSKKLKISQQSIRTSLDKLKKTGEITIKPTNKFSLVTVVNYSSYQDKKDKPTNNPTINQPTTNQQLTTNNNDNNENNVNNKDKDTRGKTSPKSTPCPYQKIIDLYHEKLPMCPKVAVVSDARKRALKARWSNGMYGIDNWVDYFEDVSRSRFLTGKTDPSPGRKQFIADIDFLIRESTIIKTQEGKYHG